MCLFSARASLLETVTLIQLHKLLLLPDKRLLGTFARLSIKSGQRGENKNGCWAKHHEDLKIQSL